ncbi:hypothetical protein [Pseudomonas sp.]|jgi:hypothetical protein|uniref:hypothetical protein n=1 Tax=Pseudomonas sp. TaxID=306 RepID=UPI00272B2B7C|nr:hypothetical protein [Pseudomonas sp.]
MALWWCITSNARCSYTELKRRRGLALGWRELGSLQQYIKDDPRWERQFKARVQIKGDLAYSSDRQWKEHGPSVPDLFWRFINIPAGDYFVLLESGGQLTMGRTEVVGVARAPDRSIGHYHYDEKYDHAHQIYDDLDWKDWDRARCGELNLPRVSFKSLLQDDAELSRVEAAWATLSARSG